MKLFAGGQSEGGFQSALDVRNLVLRFGRQPTAVLGGQSLCQPIDHGHQEVAPIGRVIFAGGHRVKLAPGGPYRQPNPAAGEAH